MLIDVIDVEARTEATLYLRFEDGTEGEVDLRELVEFTGVLASLSDPDEFAKVRVHPDFGTVYWPNGADLDPDVLYAALTGRAIDLQPAAAACRQAG